MQQGPGELRATESPSASVSTYFNAFYAWRCRMNPEQLSIEQLAALRDEVNSLLAERVSARRRELSSEAERLGALVTQPNSKSPPQPRAKRPVKYRDGSNEWSGCGSPPAWVKLKGDTLENYRV
jgi:hypothetical protein